MTESHLTNRLNHLDVYKGICIVFIIITHFMNSTNPLGKKMLFPFWIDMAVPVFMTITGYLSAMKSSGKTIREQYRLRGLASKWIRYIVPFLPVLMLEMIIDVCILNTPIVSAIDFIIHNGAYGQGSYYCIVMVQVVLMLPVICLVIEKYHFWGLAGCFAVNILYEVWKKVIEMEPWVYRFCALRYFFILAYGVFLYYAQRNKLDSQKMRVVCILSGLIGMIYIIVFEYMSIEPAITNQWTGTSVFAVLFIVPFMAVLILKCNIRNKYMEALGRASYNVYIVQMFYYWIIANMIYACIENRIMRLSLNVVICVSVGVVYYRIESPVTKRIISVIRKM